MSLEDAVRFMVRLGEEPELWARVQVTAGADIPALAGAHGFAFTADEFGQVLQAKPGELTEAQLDQAVGGAGEGGAVDPNALVQHVLRESYLQTTEDLRDYAEKVKYFNEVKKNSRWPP